MSPRSSDLLPHEAPPPQPAGTELAPGYRVIGHLNRGNRLDVYDAWSEERDSRCVLKTLRPDRAHERPARRALVQEGRLLRRFSHPNLARAVRPGSFRSAAFSPSGSPRTACYTRRRRSTSRFASSTT